MVYFTKRKSKTHQTTNHVSCHYAQMRHFFNRNIKISTENWVLVMMIQWIVCTPCLGEGGVGILEFGVFEGGQNILDFKGVAL